MIYCQQSDVLTEAFTFSELLSIIVPVYNIENYVKDCIDSLLNQKVDIGLLFFCR